MKLRSKERKEIEIPASSLADIAFLLIIFFMVASIVNTSKGLRFDLPAKDSKPLTVQRHEVVLVKLQQGGKISLDGQSVQEKGLEPALQQLRRRSGVNALLLQVQRDCSYGDFARVASRIRLSGFPRFSIKGVD